MKKILNRRNLLAIPVIAIIISLVIIACQRDKKSIEKNVEVTTQSQIHKIKKWWDESKSNQSMQGAQTTLSKIPGNTTPQSYWQTQFQAAVPRWNTATVHQINGVTIYEMPLDFPDELQLLNFKPGEEPHPYLSGRTSTAYLIVKEQPGHQNIAEVMWVVPNNDYIHMLDSLFRPIPEIHITNVYDNYNGLSDFTGSVKFFNLNGVQLLEEAYVNGAIEGYVKFKGKGSAFQFATPPTLARMMTVTVCTYTYIYQQVCSPEGGCTEWELIAVQFNGCDTWVLDDGINIGGGGGTVSAPSAPPTVAASIKPGAKLCGNYTWKVVGAAYYAQIKNFGASFVKAGEPIITVNLGLACVEFPKYLVNAGHDITGFVNTAYNRTVDQITAELNSGTLPPGDLGVRNRFKQLMQQYLVNQMFGVSATGATILFNEGCGGSGTNIPISEPKYCPGPSTNPV
ncbi:hypothetical protein [Chitinophaga niabensis]|uniref:Uncharacterized protein n=1 Tax=Chitinophaga niabensis TaxID=536979 RepID=A0A1N6FKA3_9BACT|nr:hypothetical protein [Chitinophaga niabensis]SIN95685.1 hypothetical protein SAMN04488055_2266 [Chitinophaga niabensis]